MIRLKIIKYLCRLLKDLRSIRYLYFYTDAFTSTKMYESKF